MSDETSFLLVAVFMVSVFLGGASIPLIALLAVVGVVWAIWRLL